MYIYLCFIHKPTKNTKTVTTWWGRTLNIAGRERRNVGNKNESVMPFEAETN